jgi:hypothetical protein
VSKITLSNLGEHTSIEVFEYIKAHLLDQMKKSMYDGVCQYRSPEGLKCAAGFLMGDDEYNPKWENRPWLTLAHRGAVPTAHSRLIHEMQYIHDVISPHEWKYELDRLEGKVLAGEFDCWASC